MFTFCIKNGCVIFVFRFCSQSGEVWNTSKNPFEPWSLDTWDWPSDRRVQTKTQRAYGILSTGHWSNVWKKCKIILFSAPLCYGELGSNRKYLNCLSQHLRSTHKTTIPHLQHKLLFLITSPWWLASLVKCYGSKLVSVSFFSQFSLLPCQSVDFPDSFWKTMILKPQVFKHL